MAVRLLGRRGLEPPTKRQWSWKLIGNSIHDSYGECADVLAVDGATIEGNKIYNCVSTNVFVSNSQNVTINRNWISANTDRYDRPEYGYRATGIQLANEGSWAGWSLRNVRITNNIVEWVSQGIRYWRSRSGGDIWRHLRRPLRGVQHPEQDAVRTPPLRHPRRLVASVRKPAPAKPDPQHQRKQLVLDAELGLVDHGREPELQQRNASSSPGIKDTWGTYASAYELRSGAAIRDRGPWSESDMPSTDYNCQSRGKGTLEHARGDELTHLPRGRPGPAHSRRRSSVPRRLGGRDVVADEVADARRIRRPAEQADGPHAGVSPAQVDRRGVEVRILPGGAGRMVSGSAGFGPMSW